MNKFYITLASAAVMAFNTPVFAADSSYESTTKIQQTANGDYTEKSKTKETDSAGTTSTQNEKLSVKVDRHGNTSKTLTNEEAVDPKGLMNKQTTKTTDAEKAKNDGSVEFTHKKTVNGKVTENTSDTAH